MSLNISLIIVIIFLILLNLKMENITELKTVDIITLLKEYNQNQLMEYLDLEKDNYQEKEHFINKLKQIDWGLLKNLHESYLRKEKLFKEGEIQDLNINLNITKLENHFSKEDFSEEVKTQIINSGYENIASGKVALLILAGGQGSRLGFNKAKGLYNINMPSKKTLFEYLSNRFLSVQKLANKYFSKENTFEDNVSILLIMTSKENHQETIDFYKQNNYFGINPDNIRFFPQDTLPAIDVQGNIIIKDKFEIFEAPNGNGGCFIALKKANILEFLQERKVEFINVISIDNPLTKTLDPFFVGLTVLKNQKMSAKTIPKTNPKEAVGIFVKLNGKPTMIDYADLDENLSTLREENSDKLVFRASNILNYLIRVDILQNILHDEVNFQNLINDFHIAKKKIPFYDFKSKDNNKELNRTVSGLKFELFFNTLFVFAEDLMLFEVERDEEFAPVKNPETSSTDNPKTTRQLMSNLFKKWLDKSGIKYVDKEDKTGILEISFLKSYDGENLADEFKNKFVHLTNQPFYLN